jgi:hypothetical protein
MSLVAETILKKTIFDPMNLKFIVDKPTVPVVVYVVCKITSAVVLDYLKYIQCFWYQVVDCVL